MNKIKNLTKIQKIGLIVAAVVVIAAIVIAVILGGNGGNGGSGNESKDPSGTYTITVTHEGGAPMEDIRVYVYADASKEDLTAVGKTNEEGSITFESQNAMGQVIVLENVPRGFIFEESYVISEKTTNIVLDIQLLSANNLANVTFALGDVFADMSIVDSNGDTHTISQILEEKEAVVLNFWYLNCQPCKSEFPYLQEAYELYKDKMEVLAVNPVDGNDASINVLMEEMGLTFPMASIDASWESIMKVMAYPTTVVIDRYGIVSFVHSGAVTESGMFEALFAYYTAEDYTPSLLRNFDDIVIAENSGDGSQENPFEIVPQEDTTGKATVTFQANVPAGQTVYYLIYKVDGMYLYIEEENTVIHFEGKDYAYDNGKAQVLLTTDDVNIPAVFSIENTGSKDQEYTVYLDFPLGSAGKPYDMNLGEFVASVEKDNSQGVYYLYTATESGTLTLVCKSATEGVEYSYSLYNLNTYAMRTLDEDGEEGEVPSVSIVVNKGDVVQISAGTLLDENNEYPACEFTFEASFVEGEGTEGPVVDTEEYTVIIKDKSGKPVSNVAVFISKEGMDTVSLKTDETGTATTILEKGTYTVVITTPDGYKKDSTEYTISEENVQVSILLEKKSTAQKTYTVKVVDESNKALSGVLITVGDNYATTDSKGTVTFTLVEDNYTATADKDGYTTTSKSFGKDTTITITMKKEQASTVTQKEYKVTVLDYANNPIKDAAVSFVSGGKVAKTVVVGANGVASTSLPEGNYNIEVKFPVEKDYGYDTAAATVTSSNTSVKIIAASKPDKSDVTKVWDGEYIMQNVGVGGTYLETGSKTDTFVVFQPSREGKYRIYTTSASAKVINAGSTNFFMTEPSYSGNEVTINVYSDQVAAEMEIVIATRGTEETILIIERIGEADALTVYENYVPNKAPSQASISNTAGKNKVNVDVTGNFTIVKDANGIYHKDTVDGPIIYVQLVDTGTSKAQYISFEDLISNGPFRNGDKKEDYTDALAQYIACSDAVYGAYPLTEDLAYIIQSGGNAKGWFDRNTTTGFYLFGTKVVNTEIAWMFECYYFE